MLVRLRTSRHLRTVQLKSFIGFYCNIFAPRCKAIERNLSRGKNPPFAEKTVQHPRQRRRSAKNFFCRAFRYAFAKGLKKNFPTRTSSVNTTFVPPSERKNSPFQRPSIFSFFSSNSQQAHGRERFTAKKVGNPFFPYSTNIPSPAISVLARSLRHCGYSSADVTVFHTRSASQRRNPLYTETAIPVTSFTIPESGGSRAGRRR